MIVVEKNDYYLLFKQHDHGEVSGQIAKRVKEKWFKGKEVRKDVEFAIQHHDYAWIDLDNQVKWNEEKNRPYSFIDYPLQDKLFAYSKGINTVQQHSYYAALLCSMHYASFFREPMTDSKIKSFISQEMKRQEMLREKIQPNEAFDFHFRLLQFCDDLSLYICLNDPGIKKDDEFPWFKEGFSQSFSFAKEGMCAEWQDEESIGIEPFPFEDYVEISLPFYKLGKDGVHDIILNDLPHDQRNVKIYPMEKS
ncbi:hypothetical protein HNQ94_002867 [Salirhabdus euzebyi]|uniref:DUF3891 family protein n=1 Tax=Salirhabdus euzebyi TaxID=394506 RepID=A0A841Q7M8_9BACI|nr:DUF3891 family protein [Salirhabdus euzebyi]MBB6454385.1 hypothetical protein [Salirhabdus euzebyi]